MLTHGITRSMDETIAANAPHLKPLIDAADQFYADGVSRITSEWGKKIFKAAGVSRTI